MSTQPEPTTQIRASDPERQRVVDMLQAAASDGRLTVTEADERIATAYAATYRGELTELTSDLPSPSYRPNGGAQWTSGRLWMNGKVHPALAVHAAIVLVLSVGLIARWIVAGTPFFFPIFPMAWFAISLVVHARIRANWNRSAVADMRARG